MPAFISSSASCSGVQSLASTIRSTALPPRTIRPKLEGSGMRAVTSASAVPAPGSTAAWTSSKIVWSTSGMSP